MSKICKAMKVVMMVSMFASASVATAVSVSNKDVKVSYIGYYADGRLFVVVDKLLDPACANSNWIVLDVNHVAKKEIHANALAALISDRFVDLKTTCNTASNVSALSAPGDFFVVK